MGVTRAMKDREVKGQRVVLVPYRQQHVPKYNSWMQDPQLLFLTGSEPLSLDQEYAMLNKWTQDRDKCTFIVLDAETYAGTLDATAAMIGDTNIYFADEDDLSTGEIELMIAEPAFRGKGYGKEVLTLMIDFCRSVIGVRTFVAKIKNSNEQSLRLFTNMGFRVTSTSDVFQEQTLELTCEA